MVRARLSPVEYRSNGLKSDVRYKQHVEEGIKNFHNGEAPVIHRMIQTARQKAQVIQIQYGMFICLLWERALTNVADHEEVSYECILLSCNSGVRSEMGECAGIGTESGVGCGVLGLG